MEKELEQKAEDIKQQLADDKAEIELDQPKIEESKTKSKEEKSQKQKDSGDEPAEKHTIGGYTLGDALKAPLEPPSPSTEETAHDTSNAKVKFLMVIGLVVIVFGALITLIGVTILGIILVVIGAAIISVDVFAQIR